MRLATLFVLIHFATLGVAQETETSAIPEQYKRFQGEWKLTAIQSMSRMVPVGVDIPSDEQSAKMLPEVFVKVAGMQFEMSGRGVAKEWLRPLEFGIPATKKENPYRSLKERGAKNLDRIVDVENQIGVFWFVGIYKIADDELHLSLKYCGQGLEGQHFRDFRPPSSFEKEVMEDEVRLILKRKKQ